MGLDVKIELPNIEGNREAQYERDLKFKWEKRAIKAENRNSRLL